MKFIKASALTSLALALTACPSSGGEGGDEVMSGSTESTGTSESSTSESTSDTTSESGTSESGTSESTSDTTSESTSDTTSESDTSESGTTSESTSDTTSESTSDTTTDTGVDPLLEHLVGYWKFNGDANDYSGVNIDLDLVGDPEYLDSVSMGLGTALSLDGNDGAIGMDFVKVAGDDMTLVAWVHADSLAGSWNTIIKNWGTNLPGQFHFGVGPAGADTLRNDTTPSAVTAPAALAIGQWIHCVAVLDSTAGEHRLYVDGALVATAAYAAPLAPNMATGLGIGVKPTNDGSAVANTPEVGYWIGSLDEVGIYDVALTSEEVAMVMQKGLDGIQLDGTNG